jgi:methyltransferase-like protein/SAM-dependent methyltransferase
MTEAAATSYDEVPYGSNVFFYTHPDRLAALASLLEMHTPPIDRCRVLELGCGTGANLLPMAQDLPDSRFVGIDLSPRQIGMGQAVVDALGLANIELKAMSILDVDASFGLFDYIICHGVYSWVPPEVQDKVLAICAGNLAPNGLAYVSYNTYPGWHLRGMIREMMGFHVRQFTEPKVRVEQARAILDFLVRAVGTAQGPYGSSLEAEAKLLARASDTYLYHEHLEEVNHPLYFYQFAERARVHGLQYLGEARHGLPADIPAEAAHTLEEMSPDLIHAEQYLDFVRNRTFRRTVLCHDHVALKRPPAPEAVMKMAITGLLKPRSSEPAVLSPATETFVTVEGTELSTNNPLIKSALVILAQSWPRPVSFEALWDQVFSRLDPERTPGSPLCEHGPAALAEALLQCYLSGVAELHMHAPRFMVEAGERPLASPLARLQAAEGGAITNLRHRTVELEDIDRLVLRLLDGSRDRPALVDRLAELVADDTLTIQQDSQPLRDGEKVRALLAEAVQASLGRVAGSALLLG